MPNTVVVGTQWGDEGKGKIVDLVAENFDIVARAQGGHNAGHTVIVEGEKYVLHLIPSGILHPEKLCVIGNGVVVDPFALLEELEMLREFNIGERLRISDRCHLIMPYHMAVEAAEEERLGEDRIGTTSRGIGPCYEDKAARRGVRLGDLTMPEAFREKVRRNVEVKNQILERIYDAEPLDADEIVESYLEASREILPFVTDTVSFLGTKIGQGKTILFEGAQGTLLDVDHGTYPFVTSSNSSAGGACTGTGVGPSAIDGVLGISKAYTTRVGGGPFPTEFEGEIGERVRSKGAEFGASTGRPRRCGWFDGVVGRYACRVNGVDSLVITKLDVLDEMDNIRLCVGYRYRGEEISDFPLSVSVLEEVEPVYEDHPGWRTDTTEIRSFGDLPENARNYLVRLSEVVDTDISIISTGPDRAQTIFVEGSPQLRRLLGG